MADNTENKFWKSREGAEYVARQLAFQMKINITIDADKEKRLALVEIDNRNNEDERSFWREMTCHSMAGIEVFSQPKEFVQKYFGVSGDRLALEKVGIDEKGKVNWAFHFEPDKINSMTKRYEDLVQSREYKIVPWMQFLSSFSELWKSADTMYIESRVAFFQDLARKIIYEWNLR